MIIMPPTTNPRPSFKVQIPELRNVNIRKTTELNLTCKIISSWIAFSISGGIPNVKRHVESDGGKELYSTEPGVWFKELNHSRGLHLVLILIRNRHSWDWETLCRTGCDWLLLPAPSLCVRFSNHLKTSRSQLKLVILSTTSLISTHGDVFFQKVRCWMNLELFCLHTEFFCGINVSR